MLPAPAIPASPSLPEPMRRAQAGSDPSSGQTGFPAALQAATEAAGEPAAAVPDPSSPPRLGRTMPPRPPAWRSAGGTPTGAFALAGAETSDTPATASPDAPTAGGASAALPAAAPADPHGGNVTEDDAASRPVAAADRSAAADPTIAIATKAGAAQQAGSAPRECVTASIAGAGSPASSRAAVRTRGPLPAYAGRAPAGSAADAPPHPARHPASALSIPPNVAAAAAMGVFGQMAALAGSAARAPACSSAAPAAIDTPPEQPFSSVDPSAGITSAPGPRQPGETGSQPCSGTGQSIAAASDAGAGAEAGADLAAAALPASPGEAAGAKNGAVQPMDNPAPASGSPASWPSGPLLERLEGRPMPPAAFAISPSHPLSRLEPPSGLVGGQGGHAANLPLAVDADGAPQAGSAMTAPDSPPGWAGQISNQIFRSLSEGHRDLALHLHPSGIGEIDIRVAISGHEVLAWFDSPHLSVQQALGRSIGELQRDLAMAGYELSGAWIGGEAWTPRQRTGSPALPQSGRDAANGRPVAQEYSPAPVSAASGVSVYV
jgi:hypothetical protein